MDNYFGSDVRQLPACGRLQPEAVVVGAHVLPDLIAFIKVKVERLLARFRSLRESVRDGWMVARLQLASHASD